MLTLCVQLYTYIVCMCMENYVHRAPQSIDKKVKKNKLSVALRVHVHVYMYIHTHTRTKILHVHVYMYMCMHKMRTLVMARSNSSRCFLQSSRSQ